MEGMKVSNSIVNNLNTDDMSRDRIYRLRFEHAVDYACVLDGVDFEDALNVLDAQIKADRADIQKKIDKTPKDFEGVRIVSKAEPYGYDGGVYQSLMVYGLENDKEYKARMVTVAAREAEAAAKAEKNRVKRENKARQAAAQAEKERAERLALFKELQKEFGDTGPSM